MRYALFVPSSNTVRHDHPRAEHAADQYPEVSIANLRGEPSLQSLVVDSIEELLQIDVDHPAVTCCDVLLGFGDRRVAAAVRAESVTRCVERRFVERLESRPNGLLDHAVDHVRNPKPALAAP